MSSTSTSTELIKNNEMIGIIRNLVKDLRYVSTLTNESEFGFSNARLIYQGAYEFGRRCYLLPDYRQLLTDEDKKNFKESFPSGLASLANYTPGLVNTLQKSSINLARERLSQITFVKDELLDLYREINGDKVPVEVVQASKILNECQCRLDFTISEWLRGYDEIDDDPREVPNLNGVPETHYWWTDKHRELWNNRQE